MKNQNAGKESLLRQVASLEDEADLRDVKKAVEARVAELRKRQSGYRPIEEPEGEK